jgi:glycosyltransferase involved in cell wall biosynthesis
MSIALALTVKNEAAVIERCIRAARAYVDCAVIVDTGSTDDTVSIIERVCRDLHLSLTMHTRDWVGFATNYTLALELASPHADYVWLLDADEVATAPANWEMPELTADGYEYCRLWAGDWEVWGTRIFRASRPWRYVGERHAIPRCDGARVEMLHGLEVENRRDGASGKQTRGEQRARFMRDVEHFSELLARNPSDTRSVYYLAQSYHDAGMPNAALLAYHRRSKMTGGFDEERYISLLQVARYKRRLRYSPEEVEATYVAASNARPHRCEAPVELARWFNDRREFKKALSACALPERWPTMDRLLVQRSARTWRLQLELSRAYDGLGYTHESRWAWDRLILFPDLPAPERALAQFRLNQHVVQDSRSTHEARA